MKIQIPDIAFNKERCVRDFKIMKLDDFFSQNETFHKLYRVHRLKFFQMIFINEGEGKHTVDFNSLPLKKGTLLFSYPSQIQAFENLHSYNGYICIFNEEFLKREFLQLSDRNIIDNLYFQDITSAFSLNDESLEVYFELLLKEFSENISEDIPVSLLRVILYKSKEHFTCKERSNELFNNFKRVLLTQFNEFKNVEEYASYLGVSSKHLNSTCKQQSGLTCKAFIDHFKVLEIKRHLASSTLPIKEISAHMGYWEDSNFVKFFKKHTGVTPKAFRDSSLIA